MRMQGQLDVAAQRHAGAGRRRVPREALADEGIEAICRQRSGCARYDTAQPIAASLGLPITTDAGLRERGFGIFEGHTFAEIDARWPERAARWRRASRPSAPRAARRCVDFYAARVGAATRIAAAAAGRHASRSSPRRRARLPLPRRLAAGARRAALVAARQRRINRLLYTAAALHPDRLERHRAPRRRARSTTAERWRRRPMRGRAQARGMSAAGRVRVGDPVAAIDTPALVIDLDAMERNLARDGGVRARTHGVRLRPHAKMHKCAAIARLQMAAGAVGVCVQKTSEAEALADGRHRRHLHQQRGRRAGQARARRGAGASASRSAIAVDSVAGVERLAAARGAAAGSGSTCSSRSTSARAAAARRPRRPAGAARPAGRCAPRPALRRPAGLPRRGAAPAQRGRARGGGRTMPSARGARGAGGIARRRHRLPARHRRRHRHASSSRPRAASTASCRPAATCSWTATTPTTSRRRARRASSTRCSCKSQVMSARRRARGGRRRPQVARHRFRPAARLASRDARLRQRRRRARHPASAPTRRTRCPRSASTVWLVPGHCDPTVNLHDRYVVVRGGLARRRRGGSGRSTRAAASADQIAPTKTKANSAALQAQKAMHATPMTMSSNERMLPKAVAISAKG